MPYTETERGVGPSDESLAGRAQGGDAEAFARLVRRYESPLFGYMRRMLGNAHDAEDAFQETFLRVHANLHKYRADRPFRPWVYRIATNLCRDRLRYRKRRPSVSLDAPCDTGAALGERLAAGGEGADGPARTAETRERLEAALGRLSAKHRAVFLMARYEGLPYEEIAAVLRVPVGTVKSRMNKAVKVLLQDLEDLR